MTARGDAAIALAAWVDRVLAHRHSGWPWTDKEILDHLAAAYVRHGSPGAAAWPQPDTPPETPEERWQRLAAELEDLDAQIGADAGPVLLPRNAQIGAAS